MRFGIVLLACLVALGGCKPTGGAAGPVAPEGTLEFFYQQQRACEERGGTFGAGPGRMTQVCYITPKDSGRACSKASDCEGHCLARSRSCAPVIPLFGCNDILLDSGQAATICLD